MIEIKDLLIRFNNLLFSEEVKKNSIIEILYQTIGVKIKPEDIKIKSNTVFLNIKPIYKNEILLKKDEINSKLKESLGKKFTRKSERLYNFAICFCVRLANLSFLCEIMLNYVSKPLFPSIAKD